MKKTWVIALGREFCSGGADVAQALSERMGIPLYDKVLIDHAVQKTNLSREEVIESEEKAAGLRRKGLLYGGAWYREDPELVLPAHARIYEAQCEAIRHFAGEGPCVIVGRCADYVLGECGQVVETVSVFIRANIKKRIARAMRIYNLSEAEAKKLIEKTDKIRSRYYAAHTGREWSNPDNYDLVIDTGDFGIDGAAAVIEAAVKVMLEKGRCSEL